MSECMEMMSMIEMAMMVCGYVVVMSCKPCRDLCHKPSKMLGDFIKGIFR